MPNPATTVGRTRRAAGCALLAALATLAMAGCGSGDDGDEGSPSAKNPGSASPSTATPSPSPSVTAADGSDTGACTDANCEIAVSEPVTFRVEIPDGPAKLAVTKVGKNEVGYKVTSGTSSNSSETSGEASGKGSGCTSVLYSGGSSSSCGAAGPPPDKESGAVVLQVVSGADGTAILRLVSG